jgi:hypothetical protein
MRGRDMMFFLRHGGSELSFLLLQAYHGVFHD